ncbi:hypothetical protein OG311_00950 [Streptomyces sp. NBC_01343]|uniref:hypothetical protein n=1 Tax=Streptomyces sp. NBC_01343 TaxID=2903832 RepID=UPI002E1123CB|nr:hypothetical protein OG311_00950 [Streptomyces sp. NBC_01343]
MLHTVLRRKALGESVEQIQPALIIPIGKRKGQHPSLSSIYRALAEHEKRAAYPEAVTAAHTDFAALRAAGGLPGGCRQNLVKMSSPQRQQSIRVRCERDSLS